MIPISKSFQCSECESTFNIEYFSDEVNGDISHCPFCGSYFIDHEDDSSDDSE